MLSLLRFSLPLMAVLLLCAPLTSAHAKQAPDVVRMLFDYDRSLPVPVEKGEPEDRDGIRWTPITFISVLDQPVTAWLVEKPGQTPRRLMVLQHGNGNSKKNQRLQYIAQRLVKEQGYTAILTDAMFHGERKSPVFGHWDAKALVTLHYSLRDLYLQTVRDHRRILDAAKTELELDVPVDYLGESLGSLMGTVLLSVEKRVDRGIFLVGGADFLKINPMTRTIKDFDLITQIIDPKYYMEGVKAPVLMLSGKSDIVIPPVAGKALFAGLGSEQKKQVWFDSGHELPQEEVYDTILSWFAELDAAKE